MDRRSLLISLGLSPLLLSMLPRASKAGDDGAKDEADEHLISWLFVHSAHSATLAGGKLTLGGVSAATLYFSDRPERIAGHEPTEDFVAAWGAGDDSFASNNPNAVLSILEGGEAQEVVVVLSNPRLESGDLIYDVKVLDGNTEAKGGASSLFIDVIGRPMSPGSVAGVHRRRRRRAITH